MFDLSFGASVPGEKSSFTNCEVRRLNQSLTGTKWVINERARPLFTPWAAFADEQIAPRRRIHILILKLLCLLRRR